MTYLLTCSKLLEMPLVATKSLPSRQDQAENKTINYLDFECDPSCKLGLPPSRFVTRLIARSDMQPLDCETVEALIDFCRYHLMAYAEKCEKSIELEMNPDVSSIEPSRVLPHRQKVLDQIEPDNFSEYAQQWTAERSMLQPLEVWDIRADTVERAKAGLERMGIMKEDYNRITSILFNRHAEYVRDVELKFGLEEASD